MDTDPVTITAEPSLLCGGCGYDLRGASGRCPECGRRFDPGRLADALIPWEQRRQIGRITAYVRTVRMVVRHRREVAAKVGMPVSLADAKRFRLVTLLLAFLPAAALACWLGWHLPPTPPTQYDWRREWERLFNQPASLAVLLAGILAALFLADGVARWFVPRSLPDPRRQRVVTISYYGCAALGAMPLVPVASALVLGLAWLSSASRWFAAAPTLAAAWFIFILLLMILACPVPLLVILAMWMEDPVELMWLAADVRHSRLRLRMATAVVFVVRLCVLMLVPAALEVLAALVALFILSWS